MTTPKMATSVEFGAGVPDHAALYDDDLGVDQSPFHATGPSFAYDSVWLARGIGAALVAADPDTPYVQLEIFDGGVLVVGTDTYSLLRAWVPNPSPDGWAATQRAAAPSPELGADRLGVFTIEDTGGGLSRWAAVYGKASRAKNRRRELAAVDFGTLDTDQPSLSEELEQRAVRFGGGEQLAIVNAELTGRVEWWQLAAQWEAGEISTRPVWLGGRRAVQLGSIANIVGHEQAFRLQPRWVGETENAGSTIITVDYGGFPHVSGYIASPRVVDEAVGLIDRDN